ncbi:hypothetical protein S40285_09213 [Stachybotrys chlorohalonatus IBT 40285]|uniref:Xylanolytic transcriptional activator regulatory domain-containing protein n=1 Tax=Stachybotrys chlorohalonatus (strain IBT 40285) TaxID=1283841 RepID=A0A084QZC0_STAC4|nr:hypothetical protein S40285_09213 [Stachybotrys chlorohalonata IBT 40285]
MGAISSSKMGMYLAQPGEIVQNPNILGGPKEHAASDHHAEVCKLLRSAIPSYDAILNVFQQQGTWWNSFRQKTHAISQGSRVEPLPEFAARVYTSTSPSEVATLAVAYTRSAGSNYEILQLVDNMIISNSTYSATILGLECLILLGKTHTDFGQPRSAWLIWRRGMAIAQLMGLHDGHAQRSQGQIWWSIYHGERFTSLLLGLPSGFNDRAYEIELSRSLPDLVGKEAWTHYFVLGCAIEAGKIVERNTSPHTLPIKTQDNLERMDILRRLGSSQWWELPVSLPPFGNELDCLVDRMLMQLFFFHVQMYTHLPSMVSDKHDANTSKDSCQSAARELLKRYLVLRQRVHGTYLFECKTSDFVGFTATIILLLWMHEQSTNSQADLQLVHEVKAVFDQLKIESDCPIAVQCSGALQVLCPRNEAGDFEDDRPRKIDIPFFGSIVRNKKATVSEDTIGLESEVAESACTDFHYLLSNTLPISSTSQESSWANEMVWDIDQDWDLFEFACGTMG